MYDYGDMDPEVYPGHILTVPDRRLVTNDHL